MNKYYLPSYRYGGTESAETSKGLKLYANLADRYWLHALFELHFVFWPKYNLLGLIGDSYPEKVLKDTLPYSVYFQNNTDQDYELTEWPPLPLFEKVIAQHPEGMSAKSLLQRGRLSDYSEEDIGANLPYYIRTDIYDDIFETLSIEDILESKKNTSIVRFTLCALENMNDELQFNKLRKSN